jgi:hypothetical protein
MIQWRIWYTDNIIIDGSTAEEWAACPMDGVLAIAAFYGLDQYGRKLGQQWMGSDWYWMDNNTIYQNGDSSDIPNTWVANPAPLGAAVKQGRWTTDTEIERVVHAVNVWCN